MTAAIVAIIAAIGAPLAAYLVAAKRFSGRIESSDAAELWAESRSIRDWSQRRIDELQREVTRLREELRVARGRIAELEGTPHA